MSIISVSDLSVEFGATTLLRDVTFTVDSGERWGIVGRNGAGKTTLFRLIAGTLEPSRGTVARQAGLRIAMLDQYRDLGDAVNVCQDAAQGYRDVMSLALSLARQVTRLADLCDAVAPAAH